MYFCVGIVHLPTLECYLYKDICICIIVKHGMTLKRFKKTEQYLHCSTEHRPQPTSNRYEMSEGRAAIDFTLKEKNLYYFPFCDLAMNEAMIGFEGRFHLKQYVRYVEQVEKPEKKIFWGNMVLQMSEEYAGNTSVLIGVLLSEAD